MTHIRRNLMTLGLIVLFLVLCLSVPRHVFAAGEVTSVTVTTEPSAPFRYTTAAGQELTWGMESNQLLDSFTQGGNTYRFLSAADSVAVQRVDRSGVSTGAPCSIFGERAANFTQLKPNFPALDDGSGNCDVAAMLGGRVINRGVLDVFMNVSTNPSVTTSAPKNIERIDFVFDNGIVAPLQEALLERAGHLASEKRGNNSVQMAAILELDAAGQPSNYGSLVRVNPVGCSDPEICYGTTPLMHNYSFFTSTALAPQGPPEYMEDSTESVALAFVSLQVLGITPGQRYFGFSYFPRDVDPSLHSLTDPSTFPADTVDRNGPDDGADMYGAMSGYFIADDTPAGTGSVVTTSVFVDVNADGNRTDDEAGIEAIEVTLFEDTNANGVYDPGIDQQTGASQSTNEAGFIFTPGVPDGQYFVVLDEGDTDLPPGLTLPAGANPAQVTTPMAPDDVVGFAFGQGGLVIDDPTAPTATNDTFDISQNVAQTLNVLTNDLDPVGGGLTVVGVNGVSSGTIVIQQDGSLNYQPETDFVGATAFTYTIADSNGVENTGNVALNVERFSDINNNMLNDFDECGCTDLGLITGIHGSGIGALTGSLALLVPAVWYRRRRHIRCSVRSLHQPLREVQEGEHR